MSHFSTVGGALNVVEVCPASDVVKRTTNVAGEARSRSVIIFIIFWRRAPFRETAAAATLRLRLHFSVAMCGWEKADQVSNLFFVFFISRRNIFNKFRS